MTHLVPVLVAAMLSACQEGVPTSEATALQVLMSEPVGVMGTRTSLAVVLPGEEANRGRDILGSAEAELRRIEALMSTWIDGSEISHLNAAAANETVALSADSKEVLRLARQLFEVILVRPVRHALDHHVGGEVLRNRPVGGGPSWRRHPLSTQNRGSSPPPG